MHLTFIYYSQIGSSRQTLASMSCRDLFAIGNSRISDLSMPFQHRKDMPEFALAIEWIEAALKLSMKVVAFDRSIGILPSVNFVSTD